MNSRLDESRQKLRAECLASLPKWYKPLWQLILLAVVGSGAVYLSLRNVSHPNWAEWMAVPAAFLTSNLFEWGVHKNWMHRARWPRRFYRSHTLHHHKLFTADDMAMKEPRELAFVLLSVPTLAIIIAASVLFAFGMRAVLDSNAAWLFFSTETLYIIFAEAMHAAYHVEKSHWIRQFFWIRWLAKAHVLHHDMRLMRRWNFNIGIPFWDWVLRTFTLKRYPSEDRDQPDQ